MYLERMDQMRNEIYNREWRWIEQLSAAFHVFSANIGSVLKVMAVIFLPISLVGVMISDRMVTAYTLFQQLVQAGNAATVHVDASLLMDTTYQILINYGLLYMVSLFLEPVGVIAIAKMVKQYIDGKEISMGEALSEAFSLMPTIIVTGIIYGVLIFLGSMIIIPGIYFSIAWGFYLFGIGLSGKKGWDALKYSKSLVKGKWWRTFGYLWLLSIIAILWNSVFDLICGFAPTGIITDLLYHFLCYFSAAFVAVGETLLFINREAITYGVGPTVDAPTGETHGGEMPVEPVEGTVEGEPVEHNEKKNQE